jgi:hypothetical protein
MATKTKGNLMVTSCCETRILQEIKRCFLEGGDQKKINRTTRTQQRQPVEFMIAGGPPISSLEFCAVFCTASSSLLNFKFR